MAINLDDSVLVGQQKATDARYDNDGKSLLGFVSIAECKSIITIGLRYPGLPVKIAGVEYWWPPNDTDLTKDPVIKITESGGISPWNNTKEYKEGEAILYESPPGYYSIYVAKEDNIGKIPPDNVGQWGIANDGAFVPINGDANIKDTKSFESVQISQTMNFTAIEEGVGIHYIVDKINHILRLNRFPSSTPFDPDNDIVRYYSALSEIEFLWKIKLKEIAVGDSDDEIVLIGSDGEIKKIPFSELTVTTTDTPEEDSEEAFNAGGAFNLQGQIDDLALNKLDKTDYQQHFRGKFTSLSALESNVFDPPLIAGDYAQVDEGTGVDVKNYNWDADDEIWVEGGSGSAATNTDQLPEGSTNLYFTTVRVLATLLSGLGVGTNAAISATDTILQAFAKLQNQITSHKGDTANPHAVTKAQVGLSNVDNTSDVNKPISTATQNALDTKADLPNGKISGGDLTVVSTNTIRISAASWRILPNVYQTTADTDFPSIANSSAGMQRYIAFFGNTSNQIIKVEGTEGSIATMPATPANTVLINSVIVNDAGIGTAIPPDLSGYVKFTDKALDTEVQTQTTPAENNKWISRRLLIFWFNWLKTQVVNITGRWQFAGIGAGIASNVASKLTVASGSTSETQVILTPRTSANNYTGTIQGAVDNIDGVIKLTDATGQTDLIKKDRNPSLSSANTLNFIVSNADGSIAVGGQVKPRTITDPDIISAIIGASYTDNRATISVSSKTAWEGQVYNPSTGVYNYYVQQDNVIRRY